MAKTTEKYELMYIINPNLSEEETAAVVEKFKALVEQNGTLEEMEEMGKRKLAYEINYISEGYYVLVKFTSGPDFPAELDRVLGITDGILRSLITRRPEGHCHIRHSCRDEPGPMRSALPGETYRRRRGACSRRSRHCPPRPPRSCAFRLRGQSIRGSADGRSRRPCCPW